MQYTIALKSTCVHKCSKTTLVIAAVNFIVFIEIQVRETLELLIIWSLFKYLDITQQIECNAILAQSLLLPVLVRNMLNCKLSKTPNKNDLTKTEVLFFHIKSGSRQSKLVCVFYFLKYSGPHTPVSVRDLFLIKGSISNQGWLLIPKPLSDPIKWFQLQPSHYKPIPCSRIKEQKNKENALAF